MQVLDSTIAKCLLAHHLRQSGRVVRPGHLGDHGVRRGQWHRRAADRWLMGRYGVVRTFCFSVLAFTAASFLCGVAWSLPSLIFFRVLQGGVSGR